MNSVECAYTRLQGYSARTIKYYSLWTIRFHVLSWASWPLGCGAADQPLTFYGLWGTRRELNCTIVLITWVSSPAEDGDESECKQWQVLLDIAFVCGAKQTAKQQADNLSTWIRFLVTVHWRNIAKYLELENTTLELLSRTQTGLHYSPPYLKNKNVCKHLDQAFAKRCILNAHKHQTHPLRIDVGHLTHQWSYVCVLASMVCIGMYLVHFVYIVCIDKY